MNKKFLFAAMSLAALTACTDNDFESQKVAEEISPVKFEVINDALTRASMDGNTIVWNANEGDIFTLYHGGVVGAADNYQNATYTANAVPGGTATLTSPTMILPGGAIMVWPADTTFRIPAGAGNKLTIVIPAVQTNIENNIPYMSDQIDIAARVALPKNNTAPSYNNAGKDRVYPVYMRPMASQLNMKADYAGTDATLATLYSGDDPITEISVTSIELSTDPTGADLFTTEVPVKFSAAANANWTAANQTAWHTNWARMTEFDKANIVAAGQTDNLTTKCLDGNDGCKFLILPQKAAVAGGVDNGAVTVNTTYGKVVVGNGSAYTAAENTGVWYRFISAASKAAGAGVGYDATETVAGTAGADGKFKTTATVEDGLMQTLNVFSNFVAPASLEKIAGEPMGTAATRYVKVLLNHLDMTDLHITSDKQLRDAARVWQKMGLPSVTVYLDGDSPTDDNGKFEISQTTIAKIKEINDAAAGKKFTVKPCNTAGEVCDLIVITGGNAVPDLDFILTNAGHNADVVLKAGENWTWTANAVAGKKAIKVDATATGVASIINEGTFASNATATIAIYDNAAPTPAQVSTIPFVNAKDAEWNITAGDLTVQFDVTNNGTVNIKKGAEYHQDIIPATATATTFTNEALSLPGRFLANPVNEEIGLVNNAGVFAVTGTTAVKGVINNYGLIEHGVYPGEAYNKDAKTFITANEQGAAPSFATTFNKTGGSENKLGRINLPYSNKDEDNISVSAALSTGFVSVTVASGDAPEDKKLNLTVVGDKVNYVIIKGGIETVTEMTAAIKYIEFDDENDTEIAWQAGTSTTPVTATYDGLIVLSPVNIKLYTTVDVKKATYLGAKMYVGGALKYNGGAIAVALWDGYYGDTQAKVPSMYITY